MTLDLRQIFEFLTKVLEVIGVLVIVGGILAAAFAYPRRDSTSSAYSYFRQSLGRSILLGLEFLVAADIIHTVATTPTFESLGVLGLLIVIRTFLSVEIEMELEGRWPWDRKAAASQDEGEG